MKRRVCSVLLTVVMIVSLIPNLALTVNAATAPTMMWVAPTDTNNIPMQIDAFQTAYSNNTYTCQLYLPGNADLTSCYLSWDGDMQATVDNVTYSSGTCPIPPVGVEKTYSFKNGYWTTCSFKITAYQGSENVPPIFIDIDETNGNPTIAQMDGDADHETTCVGRINIDGNWDEGLKIKGRGNVSWSQALDKRPYNITLGSKINFPGIDSPKTKKWSILAEILDPSLLCNRTGFHLAHQLDIGQDTTSADVWMNGEYQGCYTVTPKTDSFVTNDGFMIEEDNYMEPEGGDPQFTLTGLNESSGWSSCYNRITVKKMGDNLVVNDVAVGNETGKTINMTAASTEIRAWLQDAWDAIRSNNGYNSKGKYYTDYIDIESFAKMYLMHEYVKSYDVCAGSILFHRDGNSDGDKLIAGPLWDLDNAMGSVYQNGSLGSADDRGTGDNHGDRRSGQGRFIPLVNEYKTSIYKTLWTKHSDFQEEVVFQYNKHKQAFQSLAGDAQDMFDTIEASARMNHFKVEKIPGDHGDNHKYSSNTTLGSGQYQQTYVATGDSRTNWDKYAQNLKTYITTRSLWFTNTFTDPNYVDPANCNHQYNVVEVPATCTADGSRTSDCPICRDHIEEVLPKIAHDYQNGVCSMCGEVLRTAAIACSPGASVTVYETQDITGPSVENATSANPRNSDTGMIDCAGDGQINFVVNLEPGYELENVTAEPSTSFKNLKGPADTKITNGYRLTKVNGDLTITVTARCVHDLKAHEAVEATCTEAGNNAYWSCDNCGKYFSDAEGTEEIEEGSWVVEATGHNLEAHAAVAATCTEAGSSAYWSCDKCGKFFSDAEGENEIAEGSWVVGATGHDLTAHEAVAATCTEAGSSAYWSCDQCGKFFSDENGENEIAEGSWVVGATGHALVEHEAVVATCTEAGNSAYWSCDRCHKFFSDESGEHEIEANSWVINALGHDLKAHAAVAATCTEDGRSAYWSCDQCGKFFSDENGENEIAEDSWVIGDRKSVV